ncbi:hypothetical protein C7476_109101 [Phyllobacterium bourgognense]|uniref:Uncharacterized protein n=1 Tax=Phyllobacterium bourgognense TaxID=314236 RepID=A0A368YQN3_9HYPH|nr:hypothetical protein C7476_109101 [Phyllobacterium bourgognense]
MSRTAFNVSTDSAFRENGRVVIQPPALIGTGFVQLSLGQPFKVTILPFDPSYTGERKMGGKDKLTALRKFIQHSTAARLPAFCIIVITHGPFRLHERDYRAVGCVANIQEALTFGADHIPHMARGVPSDWHRSNPGSDVLTRIKNLDLMTDRRGELLHLGLLLKPNPIRIGDFDFCIAEHAIPIGRYQPTNVVTMNMGNQDCGNIFRLHACFRKAST